MNYRKVNTSERQPKTAGRFLTDKGPAYYTLYYDHWERCDSGEWYEIEPKWWLEPFEISKEDIDTVLSALALLSSMVVAGEQHSPESLELKEKAKAILNLLK